MISFHNKGLKMKVEGLQNNRSKYTNMQMQTGKTEKKEGSFPAKVCNFFCCKKERDLQIKRGKSQSTAGAMVTVKGKKFDCLIRILTAQEANVSVWIRIN